VAVLLQGGCYNSARLAVRSSCCYVWVTLQQEETCCSVHSVTSLGILPVFRSSLLW